MRTKSIITIRISLVSEKKNNYTTISKEEKEFYSKIHCYFGAPNFAQYTLIKSELQKGVALSSSQIFLKLRDTGLLDILGNAFILCLAI